MAAFPTPAVGAKIPAAWGQAIAIPVSDTSVGSVAANFTLLDAEVLTLLDGRQVMFRVSVTSNNAITASAGNVADVTIFTLSAQYRPAFEVGVSGHGAAVFSGMVQTDGDVRLTNSSDSIAASGGIVLSGTFFTA